MIAVYHHDNRIISRVTLAVYQESLKGENCVSGQIWISCNIGPIDKKYRSDSWGREEDFYMLF